MNDRARAIKQLKGLEVLAPGWDSYGAAPIDRGALKLAHGVLEALAVTSANAIIVPTVEGGVQMEWDHDGGHIEIEVRPSYEIVIYNETPDGEVWEGSIKTPKGRGEICNTTSTAHGWRS